MSSGASVFNVEGTQLIAGLFWQPLSEANNGDKQKEIKSLAKELKFDIYVLRKTTINCVGFSNLSDTVKHGCLSIAAIVSKTMEVEFNSQDFIFVCGLENGQWLYIAQRDGLILPDGDKVFASEDEARSRLLEDLSLGTWGLTVCPSIWGISKSTERDLISMLPRNSKGKIDANKWSRLKNVDSTKEIARHKGKIIIALLLIAGTAFGFKTYKSFKQNQEMQAADAAAKEMMALQNQTSISVHPWKSIPVASELLRSCTDAVSRVRLFPGNWELISANCSSGNLVVTWKPIGDSGWIDHLKAIHPDAVISLDDSLASITKPLGEMQVGTDESIQPQNERLVEMYSAAQRYGFKFKVMPSAAPVAVKPLPGQENTPEPPKEWNEIFWKADEIGLPSIVLAGLSGNGFRMTGMSAKWRDGKFIWSMEGNQYVK